MALVKFMTGSSTAFNNLATKDENTLYFLNDIKQLYKGAELYCKSFEIVATRPLTGVKGILYVETSTKKLITWNGSTFEEVLNASVIIDSTVTSASANAVSSKAVYDFVISEIAKLTGGSSNAFVTSIVADNENIGKLTVQKGTESTIVQVNLNGLAQTPTYDSETRKITFPVVGSETPVEINLGKDLVVTNGDYNATSKEIILTLSSGGTINIPVGDLVDIYTASADVSGAVQLSITNNEIKGTVLVDNTTIKVNGGKIYADFSSLVTNETFNALSAKVTTAEENIAGLDDAINNATTGLKARVTAAESEISTIKQDYVTTTYLSSNYYDKTNIDSKLGAINENIETVQTALTWTSITGN